MASRRPLRSACAISKAHRARASQSFSTSVVAYDRPSIAPRPAIDIKHIRQNPALHAQNCIDRNYRDQNEHPALIASLFEQWKATQQQSQHLRDQNSQLRTKLSQAGATNKKQDGPEESSTRDATVAQARDLKKIIRNFEEKEKALTTEIEELAIALPNLTSDETPRGNEPRLLGYINEDARAEAKLRTKSHVEIGTQLDIVNFSAAGITSGWGWYFLKNEGALLEQALVQYALSVAMEHGFTVVTPPSVVYSHIASACGFRPRDQGGEQQIYSIAQDSLDISLGKPELSLTGTAEIALAGMHANTDLSSSKLPLRFVGPSRSYRAEAGSRGAETKGLYRVHEFTKVEMFGWTMPNGSDVDLFNTMVTVQKSILQSLGLRCRILEQPSTDLGASASRKQDIEAYFPSRQSRDEGWGEVTSTSLCTDYQTRRLATKVRLPSGKLIFPHTVNGTALAVPRVLAGILENHWDEDEALVRVPKVLWPWMYGKQVIRRAWS
jgi:seryl-tRNA synthetase